MRFDAVGVIVARGVDQRGDGVGGHLVRGERGEHLQGIGGIEVGVEPAGFAVCGNDDGHAVVNGFEEIVGLGGDDGEGVDGAGFGVGPAIPEAGEGEGGAVDQADAHGNLGFSGTLPFIESVSDDQASAFLERLAEAGFLSDGFGSGIDEAVADGCIVGPVGDEAPAHEFQDADAVAKDDDGGVLRRGEVVSRGDGVGFGLEVEAGLEGTEVSGDGVSAAHERHSNRTARSQRS